MTFSESKLAAFREAAAEPAAMEWIRSNAAAGLPAQELYDMVVRLIAQGS